MAAASAGKPGQSDRASDFEPVCHPPLWTMKNGAKAEIRLIHPDDEQRMIRFHKGLSERSVYMRYFESLSLAARTAHTRLARICFADPEHETVLIALCSDVRGEQNIVAVARLTKLFDPSKAEIALLVQDEFQGLGLGTELLRRLIQVARNQKMTQVQGEMLRDNTSIQRVLKKFGFRQRLIDARSVRAVLSL
jgi:acetyltransferase